MEERAYSDFIKSKEIESINEGIEFDESQRDWDRQATEKCTCMQIKVHGRKKTVRGFRQLDFRDLGI